MSPRVREDSVHPRLQAGPCAQPLNFTVRRMVSLDSVVALFTAWAARLYPVRWVFGLGAAVSLVSLYLLIALRGSDTPRLNVIAAAAFSLCFSLFLVCSWFHPSFGALQVQARLRGGTFPPLFSPRSAALFLCVFATLQPGATTRPLNFTVRVPC